MARIPEITRFPGMARFVSLISRSSENRVILVGYDVIGGPRGLGREKF